MQDLIRNSAQQLVDSELGTEPEAIEVYWFPDEQEIRLIEVDPATISIPGKDAINPFYFPPDPKLPARVPIGMALISLEERARLTPPDHWGPWERAVLIWPREKAA